MTDESLPDDVRARLEEHTAGGYILFRINGEGKVIYECSFDSETCFLALTAKGEATMSAIRKLTEDQIAALIAYDPEEEDSEIDRED